MIWFRTILAYHVLLVIQDTVGASNEVHVIRPRVGWWSSWLQLVVRIPVGPQRSIGQTW
ncbi:hypothetical protein SERLADRAFT_379171 [Serpula lacrymans var. lacrymans S7.9]|uniref:Secreted protein n=1 Tax=Serpula lacrymans var. lacrymans (strain S7.9) TaxID=578457 RepID=F8NIK2_SERL9|nr:uncharacterized protein SERLADRAFT_379171 [Serpula lacrymans var. lacrymans S7.9]EGO29764.1 hypothetical protein SERLADRAFT_379171 [Serpula lacrymans var. lacrymans S7.9]